MSMHVREETREAPKKTKWIKMDQNDQNGATIREDIRGGGEIRNERERDGKGTKKKGGTREKVRKWQEGGVFNICFHGNQPTILRLKHLLS